MSWPAARAKAFAKNGNFTPTDANAIQDQYIRAAGLVADDFDPATVAVPLGLSQAGAVRRDFLSIDTSETYNTAAFGWLATPDRIDDVVVPEPGLVFVQYHALWKFDAVDGWASLVFNGTAVKQLNTSNAWVGTSEFNPGSNYTLEQMLYTGGLGSLNTTAGTGYDGEAEPAHLGHSGPSNNGRGSWLTIKAPAGTYDIGVQYAHFSGGTITVKRRRLSVLTMGF